MLVAVVYVFFFFQAEDGIRDYKVTGVQTCALPISRVGLMAAYAEGLNILKHANAGKSHREADAETTPLRNPEHYQYDFNLADITEVWRRGSVVASWLLDLTAISLLDQPNLERFSGRVSDSGEGRWTILAAIESTAPAPVLTASLFQRFTSRGEDDFGAKVLSAMRFQFGGHIEKKSGH